MDTGQSGDTDIIAEADIGYRGHYYWRHRGLSSVSSVEEAVEDILDEAGDKSDLKPDSDAVSAEPKSKSPKYLPKFLRASFSRLISKEKSSKSGSLTGQEPLSLPFFSSVSIPSLASPTPSLSQSRRPLDLSSTPPHRPQTTPCCWPSRLPSNQRARELAENSPLQDRQLHI